MKLIDGKTKLLTKEGMDKSKQAWRDVIKARKELK